MLGQCLWLWMNKYSWGHGQKQSRGQKQNHVCILHHTHDENSPFFSQNLYKKTSYSFGWGCTYSYNCPIQGSPYVDVLKCCFDHMIDSKIVNGPNVSRQNKKILFLESSCL